VTCFVTGGLGLIGSHLVDQLLQADRHIVVGCRTSSQFDP
jgi:nucleoside-diphosphate-sugar epimerase